MSMSKKDFIALADALRPSLGYLENGDEQVDKGEVIRELCEFMKNNNPNFKEKLWRDYLAGKCGPSGGKI